MYTGINTFDKCFTPPKCIGVYISSEDPLVNNTAFTETIFKEKKEDHVLQRKSNYLHKAIQLSHVCLCSVF